MMLYDCFTFFNELEILEIRLHELSDVVDRFVLVEATVTFSGQPKELFFEKNKERFAEFADRIIHVVVDDMPVDTDAWGREYHQRNCIVRGLGQCQPDDTIMISDVDEIPRESAVRGALTVQGTRIFHQTLCYYYLNYATHDNEKMRCTRVVSFSDLQQMGGAQALRRTTDGKAILNGGWHFSYVGGVDRIRYKIQSFAHQELNIPTFTDDGHIRQAMEGSDLFDRNYKFVPTEVTSLPSYVVENLNRFVPCMGPRFREDWYSDAQCAALVNAYESVKDILGDVVEIGCWEGKSTVYLANACFPVDVQAVDTWRGNEDEGQQHPSVVLAKKRDVYADFIEHSKRLTRGNVRPHRMLSGDFFTTERPQIKFCHIDGSHDYQNVRRDIAGALSLLVPGGVLCGDDFQTAHKGRTDLGGGVERAVREMLPGFNTDGNFWSWNKPSKITLTRAAIQSVDLEGLRPYTIGSTEDFFSEREHYRLLAHLSTLFPGKTIFDIGTRTGESAFAFSYGGAHVESFDIIDRVSGRPRPENVHYNFENLFDPPVRERWRDRLLNSSIICMDIDPHVGLLELEMVQWLQRHGYRGLIVLDDIFLNDEMRINLWSRIDSEYKTDATSLGHWSGTGIVSFAQRVHLEADQKSRRIMLGTPCFREDHEMLARAFRSFCEPDVDVVAIDNGGSEDVKAAIFDAGDTISVIRNPKNVYVNPAWNQLAERFLSSGSEILVLANADLIANKGWSSSLLLRHDLIKTRSEREFWCGTGITLEQVDVEVAPSVEVSDQKFHGAFFAFTREAVLRAFPVPKELLIFFGDDWIIKRLSEAGFSPRALRDVRVFHAANVSSNRLPEYYEIIARDRLAWERLEADRAGSPIRRSVVYQATQLVVGVKPFFLVPRSEDVGYHFAANGVPEAPLISWAETLLQKGKLFVDVGSHVGTWCIPFACAGHDVVAFEAQSWLARLCNAGFALNDLEPACRACAVSDHVGKVTLTAPEEDGGGGSIVRRFDRPVISIETECTTLDVELAENQIPIGLIKIDVEGAELDVLRGAAKTILEHRPKILFECWEEDRGQRREELFRYLAEIGYRVGPVTWRDTWLAEPNEQMSEDPDMNRHERRLHTAKHRTTSGPRICLNMIVRNEAAIIERCLTAALPSIDKWSIMDTGSTDGTGEIIERFFAERGIPGVLFHTTFQNFAQARNQALDAALMLKGWDYALLIDADMILTGEIDRTRLIAPAYRLMQRDSSLDYSNTRLVHRNARARYFGVTHEYLSVEGVADLSSEVYIDDRNDGGSKSDKSERDIRLLQEGLVAEPDNARYMFYLAETYRHAGRHFEAVREYLRRIAKGGWDEEVWYSHYSIARSYLALEDEPHFVQWCLKAYDFRPSRGEPLKLLAKWYREHGKNAAAVIIAEALAKIEPTKDILFVERDIYDFGADEELSIAGYYVDKQVGYRACADLTVHPNASVRETAQKNFVYYVESASDLFGADVRNIGWKPNDEFYTPMNPSVCIDKVGGRYVLVRTVNYTVTDQGSYPINDGSRSIRTRNHVLEMDENWKPIRSTRMEDAFTTLRRGENCQWGYPVEGFEDCRLWCDGGNAYASATVLDFGDGRCEMAILKLDGWCVTSVDVIRDYEHEQPQKNWMPIVGRPRWFVYSCGPTIVVERTLSGTVERARHEPSVHLGHLRGGSQLIEHGENGNEGWLAITHEVVWNPGRVYLHRFVKFDRSFKIVAISDPFYFAHVGIEFCAGLARDGDRLVASFGVNDASAHLAFFDPASIDRSLNLIG